MEFEKFKEMDKNLYIPKIYEQAHLGVDIINYSLMGFFALYLGKQLMKKNE